MRCKEWSKAIKGADDFELGIARTSDLVYHCAAPAAKADGLVFVIAGFGGASQDGKLKALCAYLAATYNLLAVTVEYHCYRSRLSDGATIEVTDEEFSALRGVCARHGIGLLHRVALLSTLAELPVAYEFEVKIRPPHGDYQNFGVMQALDHLLVLHDLGQPTPASFDESNIIALGAGYGGYLAHLIAKFAPNTLRAVFDHSSPAVMPVSYLFGGKANDAAPYFYHIGKIRLFPLLVTHWSLDAHAAGYLSPGRQAIRNTALPSHVASMRLSAGRPCQYRMAHAAAENAPLRADKRRQAELLAGAGFDVVLSDQGSGQGGQSGDLTQGDDAFRLQTMFDDVYPSLVRNPGRPDCMLETSIAYLCDDLIYGFEHGKWGCAPNVNQINIKKPAVLRLY